MKKLNFIIGIILLCAAVAFSQSASLTIASLKAQVGDTVDVPINVSNLSNVGAISLAISYDATILQYAGVENGAVSFINNASNGKILLGWFDNTASTPLNISSGKLVDLKFVVLSTAQVNLNFLTSQCEISDESGSTITSQLTDGAVNNVTGASLTIANKQANVVGDTVVVPVSAANLSNVGAVSLKISYNASILSFAGIANAAVTLTSNATNGVLTLGWFDNTAQTPLNLSSGKLVDLKFVVNNTTTDYLNFMVSQCELSDENGNTITVLYNNGTVNSVSTSSTSLQIEKVIATPGTDVAVPVKVYGFNKVGAISLKINYNNAVLTFDSLSNAPSGVNFIRNASGGVISVGWFDATAQSPISLDSVNLFVLNFSYIGGQSDLTFNTSKCEISNDSGTSIGGVSYMNGGVIPASGTAPTFQIGNVQAKPQTAVTVPIFGKDLHHVGAISLQINYDTSVVSFQGTSNAVNGISISSNVSEGVLSLSWYQTGNNSLNLDSTAIVDLNFNYSSGSSNISFLSNKSEIADSVGSIIQTVVYTNGSISEKMNSKPYFTKSVADTNVTGYDTLFVQFAAADSDAGQTLTFMIVSNSRYASISPTTGLFRFIGANTNHNFPYTIGVTDGIDTTTTVITISTVTGIVQYKNDIPKVYALSQNYPNPFNPSTNIDFTLPKESKVVLKIYNLLGQEVTTLLNQQMSAGRYKYEFNANKLSSGVYIYRLQAGNYVFTKKMTLLK